MLSRKQIIDALRQRLEAQPECLAAWLGGSDSTGRSDEMSDVDLMLICRQGQTEVAAETIESAVGSISPIRIRYRLPKPTWHGFEQAFCQLELAPEYLMVDWLIMEEGQKHPWFEVERHGEPKVLFDKANLIHAGRVDRLALAGAIDRKVAELRLKFPLFRHLPVKLVRRDLPVDAAYFYQALVLRPLVDLLRCVHCPQRHDYGFRYVKADLPADCYETIRQLSYFNGPDQILEHVEQAGSLFDSALRAWDSRAENKARSSF